MRTASARATKAGRGNGALPFCVCVLQHQKHNEHRTQATSHTLARSLPLSRALDLALMYTFMPPPSLACIRARCTALDVIAVDRNNGVYSNDAMPTWGGNAVRGGEADGRLHMWVGARAEPSTPLASNDSYTCNSKVVHLVESKSGPGGSRFELASPQPLALGRMHYSPNTIKIPGQHPSSNQLTHFV